MQLLVAEIEDKTRQIYENRVIREDNEDEQFLEGDGRTVKVIRNFPAIT